MTRVFYDELFLEHIPGVRHPEQPERLRTSWRRLQEAGLDKLRVPSPKPIDRGVLRMAHAEEQIQRLEEASTKELDYLDGDTPVTPKSMCAALLASACAIQAVDDVLAGQANNAFCLMRPPGHHATPNRSMGFCLFNHIALAARHALAKHGLSRVLIVDWDVHHGNGTQDIFYEDPAVFFFSAHRYPFYPGTGSASETGAGKGLGCTLNLPVTYGTPPADYRKRFADHLAKAADTSKPELVLLSAGFDAHRLDPIGSLDLELDDFAALGEMVLEVAATHAKGRLVSLLEGGYNVKILAQSVEQHVKQLAGVALG